MLSGGGGGGVVGGGGGGGVGGGVGGDGRSGGGADRGSSSSSSPPPSPSLLTGARGEFLHGFGASAVSILLTFPLAKLASRQTYEGLSPGEAARTMRADGLAHLYRGVLPPLLQKGVSMGVCYGAFDFYFHALTLLATGRREPRAATDVPMAESSLAVRAGAAAASGSTEALFTPFERVQTILQHRHYTERFANTADVLAQLRPYGLRELFRGASAILLRNGPCNAAFFMLREPVHNLLPAAPPAGLGGARAAPLWAVARDFFAGAMLGASLSTLFFPVNVAKNVMQLQIGGRFRGIAETIAQVYAERRGLAGMYRGVGGNALRALVSWGIVNASYEIIKKADRGRLSSGGLQ